MPPQMLLIGTLNRSLASAPFSAKMATEPASVQRQQALVFRWAQARVCVVEEGGRGEY